MSRLKLTEIFYSLQGEADSAGIPTTFIRLTGCPLRCLYCQNPDTWLRSGGTATPVDEMAELMGRYARFIAAAGGGGAVYVPAVVTRRS